VPNRALRDFSLSISSGVAFGAAPFFPFVAFAAASPPASAEALSGNPNRAARAAFLSPSVWAFGASSVAAASAALQNSSAIV